MVGFSFDVSWGRKQDSWTVCRSMEKERFKKFSLCIQEALLVVFVWFDGFVLFWFGFCFVMFPVLVLGFSPYTVY